MKRSLAERVRTSRAHQNLRGRFGESYIVHALAVTAGAVEVTWLSLRSTPEVVPFGEELGLVASSLAMSYIAAYLFRLLLITGPDKRNQRRARSAFHEPLHMIAHDGDDLISELEYIAKVSESRPLTDTYVHLLCGYVDWRATVRIAERLDEARKTWDKLAPNIYLFEPELILLLRRVSSTNFRDSINMDVFSDYQANGRVVDYGRRREYVFNLVDKTKTRMTLRTWDRHIKQYVSATSALKDYLEDCTYEEEYVDGLMEHWTSDEFVIPGRDTFAPLTVRLEAGIAPDGGPLDTDPITTA